jgi:hypothetical protein
MGVPFIQKYRIAQYVFSQKLRGRRRYPLVLMLEPLFRCNLACAGCGKICYPEEVLDRRLSADECGAPVISIAGGEPLIHPLKAVHVFPRGPGTDGPFAPDPAENPIEATCES